MIRLEQRFALDGPVGKEGHHVGRCKSGVNVRGAVVVVERWGVRDVVDDV